MGAVILSPIPFRGALQMLPADKNLSCPDCVSPPAIGRRDFIRVLSTSAAALAIGGLTPLQKARAARAEKQAQAEALVFELYKSMDGDQKKKLVLPWDAGGKGGLPARLHTVNAPVGKSVIGLEYDKKQTELLDRIFRSICNGEEGYKRLSRNGKFDNSGSFESSGALIYGEPVEGKKFSLVFASHHLTLRVDGNSEEATAFGGPLYYGHSPSGYATTNVFHSQTKIVTELHNALDEKQRKVAVMPGKWMDEHGKMKVPGKDTKVPGLSFAELAKDQKELTEKVMKELVSPYRKEDGDEVLEIIKANGGFEKLSIAFYQEGKTSDKEPWTYWRLEGPGFVWSLRALPHIHTFVNITSKLA
ncbi:MAG: hypothetical protein C0467_27435 [Planctomycetaceae bacterium]|nr:hypothetical protein [Planctomycetaceae bacterium]